MRKDLARRNQGGSLSSNPSQILKNRSEIEAGLNEKINASLAIDEAIKDAENTRNEWTLRLQIATHLLTEDPDNSNLQTLVDQAQIHFGLTVKKLDALKEQQVQSMKTRQAAYEALKQLQRIELLQASGSAMQGHRNELTEIMTRTAQLELSSPEVNREALRSEYYMQAMLELSMEKGSHHGK